MKYLKVLLIVVFFISKAFCQNYIPILPTDTPKEVIYKAAHVVPTERQLRWQKLELVAFFHFGINTFTGNEWGSGKDDISLFNPKRLDAGQWIKTVKDAGFKQVILTVKHHDGFCLWPTKYSAHSIRNTPYKNGKGDVVREVADACKKYDIGFGIYLSPWDRNSAYYGDSIKYNEYFVHQLTELLTKYGKVDEVWFDGANGEGPNGKKQWYDFNRWYALIRKLQPQAVIANMGPDARWVGTESGIGREMEWSVLPLTTASQNEIAMHSQKEALYKPQISGNYSDQDLGSRSKLIHAPGLIWYPAETDVSIRPGWFYHANQDSMVKSKKTLMDIYFSSVGRNGVLLLNIPPDTDGLISKADVQALQNWRKGYLSVFNNNLAKEAIITCTNATISATNKTKLLTDKKLSTYLTTKVGDTTAIIQLAFKKQVDFNVLALQEDIAKGQRIERFEVEAMQNGSWKQIAAGSTVGFKRLLHLPEMIQTELIRIKILSSRLNPFLAEVGVYKTDF